jgi:predicted small secreted protein
MREKNLDHSKDKPMNGSVMIKRIVLLLLYTVTLVLGSIGCHTAHGAGEDLEAAGQKIQEKTPP